MRKTLLPLFFLLGVLVYVYPEPAFVMEGSAEPGSVLGIYLDSSYEATEARLEFSNGTTTAGRGFSVNGTEGDPFTVFLLGIPAQTPPGMAALEIVGVTDGVLWSLTKDLSIGERIFNEETISLTESLTRLREDEQAVRAQESMELYRILISFHPDALFDPGPYIRPIEGGRLTSWFGDRRTYRYHNGGTSGSIHAGIDLAAHRGTAVYACGDGRVVLSKSRIITGETVVIEHLPGVYSLYYHLDRRFVGEEETVYAGKVLGTLGMTGFATGPHLHWEFRVGGVPVDPEPLLSRGLIDKIPIIGIMKGQN